VDAWVAIDAIDAAALEGQIKRWVAHYANGLTAPVWAKLVVTHKGTQVAVHGDKLEAAELAQVVGDLLEAADNAASAPTVALECPPASDVIVSCHDGTHIKLSSIAELLRELSAVDAEQVVSGNDVIGIRFTGDPPHLLRRNDVLLGIGAHRVTDGKQLAAMAKTASDHESMAVRRDGVEVVLDLTE
jgi:hypothetical protein